VLCAKTKLNVKAVHSLTSQHRSTNKTHYHSSQKRNKPQYKLFFNFFSPRQSPGAKGVFVSLRFQVIADFSLTQGKPSLVSTVLFSTHAACTQWPILLNENISLTISRIFPTLQLARSYIAYLYRVYKKPIPPLVIDGGQQELFLEVSK
jgi:hypothetical protein